MLAAFAKNRVSDNLFAGTTGYGYDDYGRDTLDKIYADIFGTEAALVRIGFVNGTHALSCAMFSAVKTGDTVLSVTGPAYDTLQNTITGDYCGRPEELRPSATGRLITERRAGPACHQGSGGG